MQKVKKPDNLIAKCFFKKHLEPLVTIGFPPLLKEFTHLACANSAVLGWRGLIGFSFCKTAWGLCLATRWLVYKLNKK